MSTNFSRLRVLIAEDNVFIRETLTTILRQIGVIHIISLEKGADVIEELKLNSDTIDILKNRILE